MMMYSLEPPGSAETLRLELQEIAEEVHRYRQRESLTVLEIP